MFPPTINTTPNSPIVWANARTTAVTTEGRIAGNNTRNSVSRGDFPRVAAASASEGGSERNPERSGCTMNGRL